MKLILVINSGSSSIKFGVYKNDALHAALLSGEIENIGMADATLNYLNNETKTPSTVAVPAGDHISVTHFLIDWLAKQIDFENVIAIGHRVVHGMQYTEPQKVTTQLLAQLKSIRTIDPDHLPAEIELMEIFINKFQNIAQVACFDTSFHAVMPDMAKLLAIPYQYRVKGMQRYGFHGLSYTYLLQQLEKEYGRQVAKSKIIMAHLGSGASLAAINNGLPVDTTMGFTPASGLPMSTRTGDIDPGALLYLMKTTGMNVQAANQFINHQAGLLGISGTTGDMRELLKMQITDNHAAEAVEFFCYQAKKIIGSFTAILGGLDTLVFSGGIGQHQAEIRKRICNGLQFMGIELSQQLNGESAAIISTPLSAVTVYVIPTNEELMIACLVADTLNNK